jgi:hypothetical protein
MRVCPPQWERAVLNGLDIMGLDLSPSCNRRGGAMKKLRAKSVGSRVSEEASVEHGATSKRSSLWHFLLFALIAMLPEKE